jgi:HAMP domain-containing protein
MIRQMITPSLRTRILFLILLAVVPLTAVTFFNAAEQRATSAAEVQADALRLARAAAIRHEQLIESTRQTLIVLSQLPAVRNDDAQACSVLFADLLRQTPYYANLAVVHLDGDVSCSAVPFTEPVNVADRPWFQQVIQTRTFTISEYQIGRISRKAGLTTAYPVMDETGALLGIVAISIDIAWLSQLVATTPLPASACFTILDRAGTVLARTPDSEAWVGRSVERTPFFSAIQGQHGSGTAIAPGLDGQMRLFGFTTLRPSEAPPVAYLAVGIPTAQAFAETDRVQRRNLIVLGGMAVVGVIAAWLLADRWLIRRLRQLAQTAARLGAGEWSARTGQNDASELGQLAHAFDNMAAALEAYDAQRRRIEAALMLEVTEHKRAEEALRESATRYRALVENVGEGIGFVDPEE